MLNSVELTSMKSQTSENDNIPKTSLVYKQSGSEDLCSHTSDYDSNSPSLRLNTICPYYTMFPLDFPLRLLKNAQKGDWVLDPFCGRGTTLFAARMRGLNSIGIDSNPIAAAVTAAKVAAADANRVVGLAEKIMEESQVPDTIPQGDFWSCCYHPDTLKSICIFREWFVKRCLKPEEIVLRALLLGVLHGPLRKGKPGYLSNQMPRTYATKPVPAVRYWQRHSLIHQPYVDVLDLIKRRVEYSLLEMPPASSSYVYCDDARRTDELVEEDISFQWVITSPPYFGMRSYKSDQWLRNWFLGGVEDVDYERAGQLTHKKELFVQDLAEVWQRIAKVCLPGAKLIIRFGSLSSESVDAVDVLKQSLKLADCGWQIKTRRNAGSASSGYRQSQQFNQPSKKAIPEFDLYARLEV